MNAVGIVLSCLFVVPFWNSPVSGVPDDELPVDAILFLEGADAMEDLSEDVLSVYRRMSRKPLEINRMTLQELSSSGLLTHYQAVTLTDYIKRNGDILSLAELSTVDGIGEAYAGALAPFVSLSSGLLPGKRRYDIRRPYMELEGASSFRVRPDNDTDYSYRTKYSMDYGSIMEFKTSFKRNYGTEGWLPSDYGFSTAVYGRKFLSKLIIGDFNARFGHGLTLWNGFSLSGVSSPESFSRRATGITMSNSYSTEMSLRGAAAELKFGNFTLSPLIAVESFGDYRWNPESSILPGGDLSWYGETCQLSFCVSGKENCSADARVCVRGVDLFAELAYDMDSSVFASVAGSVFRIGEKMKMGVALRCYPESFHSEYSGALRSGTKCSDEHGISLSGILNSSERLVKNSATAYGISTPRHVFSFGIDNVYNPEAKGTGEYRNMEYSAQSRVVLNDEYWFSPSLGLKTRITSRLRTYLQKIKSDARLQLDWCSTIWRTSLRLHFLYSESFSALAYGEAGVVTGQFKAYFRTGVFHADKWNDRIYVYERDAPGNFSSPAFYGRGLWASLYCACSPCRYVRLYLRASGTAYARPEKNKPGQAELKFQFVISLPES